MNINPVERHKERMAQIEREIEEYSSGTIDMVEHVPALMQARYIAEFEWIVYTSVRLTDIMLDGHSEETYNRITKRYEGQGDG